MGHRYGDLYGESDAGMRWLKDHDPDALHDGYAGRVGIIDHANSRRLRRNEYSMRELEVLEEMAERKASRHG